MCLAIPGKILELKGSTAIVEYFNGERTTAKIVDGSYKKGDFVIVQAKLVIENVPKEEAESWLQAIKEDEG